MGNVKFESKKVMTGFRNKVGAPHLHFSDCEVTPLHFYPKHFLSFDEKKLFQVSAKKFFLLFLGYINLINIVNNFLDIFRLSEFIGIIRAKAQVVCS